jgi:hypothetical protein
MSKFSIGEIAIYEYDQNCVFLREETRVKAQILGGSECEILSTSYFCNRNQATCYDVRMDGGKWIIEEHCLRKRPSDESFSEWFRNTIITDPIAVPLETTMRNVARNLQSFTEGKANGS